MASPRSLWDQAALRRAKRRNSLVCVAGASPGARSAGRYRARCGRACRLLSLGARARALHLVVRHPRIPPGHLQRVRAGATPARRGRLRKWKRHISPRPREPSDATSCAAWCSTRCATIWCPMSRWEYSCRPESTSNVVAALAAEHSSRLQTLTLAFEEYAGTDMDEAPLAEEAARVLGSEHTTIRIGRGEFEALLDDFLASMDQPTIDGLNTYLVSHAAAKLGLKVVLSGLGGDELFGGYPSFREVPELARWGRRLSLLQPLGNVVQRTLRALALPGLPPKAAGLLSHSSDLAKAYLLRRALYLEDELPSLLDESWVIEGLERLATASALAATLAPLRAGRRDRACPDRRARIHAGTCATSCFAIPTGRAWRTVSRCECRSWTLHCSRAWGRRLLPPIPRPSATLPPVAAGSPSLSAVAPRPALPLLFGSGSRRAEEEARSADCGAGRFASTTSFECAAPPMILPRRLAVRHEMCRAVGVRATSYSIPIGSWLASRFG